MIWRDWIENWLYETSYDLWSRSGIDARSGLSWEALDHNGVPLATMSRRVRVQFRQAYCFARHSLRQGSSEPLGMARMLCANALQHGICPETGHLVSLLTPDLSIAEVKHDFYDLAFVLLSVSALIEAGAEMAQELTWVEHQLASLKAERGWHEAAAQPLPRRQNPHMHLFEATTEAYRVTGEPRFLDMAKECLSLFQERFLTKDGAVLEFFDADWTPLPGPAQQIEPGHAVEWIYLLDHYEAVTGQAHGADLETMFRRAAECVDSYGFLPDRSAPAATTRRLWPQTELLKAALVLHRKGIDLPPGLHPDEVLEVLISDYLSTPAPGGWYDTRRCGSGELLSDNMPASTYYHLLVALEVYLAFTAEASAG